MPVPDPNSHDQRQLHEQDDARRASSSARSRTSSSISSMPARRIYVNNAQVVRAGLAERATEPHRGGAAVLSASRAIGPITNLTRQQVRRHRTRGRCVQRVRGAELRAASLVSGRTVELNSPFSLRRTGSRCAARSGSCCATRRTKRAATSAQTWFALVNTTTNGQTNFNAVFGDITTEGATGRWRSFVDDIDLSVPAKYTHPSWNYRSIIHGPRQRRRFRSRRRNSSAERRCRCNSSAAARRTSASASQQHGGADLASASGQPLPANIDFILVRTQ